MKNKYCIKLKFDNEPFLLSLLANSSAVISGGTSVRCTYVHVCRHLDWLFQANSSPCIEGFWNTVAHLFTLMRQCVACKAKVPSSKGKVTVTGQSTLAHLFTLRRCVACRTQVPYSKGHSDRSKVKNIYDRPCPAVTSPSIEGFWNTLTHLFKCDMKDPLVGSTGCPGHFICVICQNSAMIKKNALLNLRQPYQSFVLCLMENLVEWPTSTSPVWSVYFVFYIVIKLVKKII